MPKESDFAQTRKNLASYSDDQLIGAVELAALLATTAAMIYRYLYTNASALPPPMAGFGRKRVWRLGNCRDWLRKRAGPSAEPMLNQAPVRRTGRPRATDAPATPIR